MRFGPACALALLVLAAGCGGSGTLALDPVASAADRTVDKQTGHFETRFNGALVEATAIGTFSVPDRAMELTTTIPGLGDEPIPLELRMLYPVLYVHAGGVIGRQFLPIGKSWAKLDLRRPLDRLGVGLPQLGMGGSQSPVDGLTWLRGSKHARKLGTETIDGAPTTHYRVTVDRKDALAKATPGQREALRRFNTPPQTIDVWIGDDGLVRRITQRLGTLDEVTTTFSDYGTPVHIEAPPADETVDLPDLLKNG